MENKIKLIIVIIIVILVAVSIYKYIKKTRKNIDKYSLSIDNYTPEQNANVCSDKTTFVTYARSIVNPLIKSLITNCVIGNDLTCGASGGASKCDKKKNVLATRDALNIWNAAWFPLQTDPIKWIQIDITKKGKFNTTNHHTHDPMEPLLYYLSVLYTTMGSIGDAQSAGNTQLQNNLTTLSQMYERCLQILMGGGAGNGLITGITTNSNKPCGVEPDSSIMLAWSDYFVGNCPIALRQYWYDKKFKNPVIPGIGMYCPGIYWKDNKKVAQVSVKNGRFPYLKGAIWGGIPNQAPIDFYKINTQPTTASQAISIAVYSAHIEASKRWSDMRSSSWWPSGIATSKNIDEFHKVRKSIRALVRIVLQYPFVYSSLALTLSPSVIQMVDPTLPVTTTYSDIIIKGSKKATNQLSFMLFSSYNKPSLDAINDGKS